MSRPNLTGIGTLLILWAMIAWSPAEASDA